MKLKLSFKCPEAIDGCLEEYRDEIPEEKILSKWIKYGEYVRIEVDTVSLEARVVPA